ncbi:MAG: prepilin-type N-terminal cleavage/methylation domain-containing protein [Candidatus Thiodiazotropha sp.]
MSKAGVEDHGTGSGFAHTQAGLTLLELLLVVSILSATAMLAIATVGDDAAQQRLRQTEHRLLTLKQAAIQVRTFGVERLSLASGYVVDNGRLPPCVQGLLEADDCDDATDPAVADFLPYELQTPVFDPTPDGNGFNNNSGDEENLGNARLWKGFRPVYLPDLIGDSFRDGWGSQGSAGSADCPDEGVTSEYSDAWNHGWCVVLESERITWKSYGRDGLDEVTAAYADPAPYDDDLSLTLEEGEWAQPVTTLTINVTTGTGVTISSSSSNLAVALVEFVNGQGRQYWRQTFSAPAAYSIPNSSTESFTLTLNQPLPVGRHTLVLISHDGTGPTELISPDWTTTIEVFPFTGLPSSTINWTIE